MYHATIINPKTGRQNQVRVFTIASREAINLLKTEGTAKAISWALLNQPESLEEMAEEQHGDCARSNFALSAFENALDWRLGLAVVEYIKAVRQATDGRNPKLVRVAVNRSGDVFVLSKMHTICMSF